MTLKNLLGISLDAVPADKALVGKLLPLNANGYRTLTSKPGHHQTAIQTLPLSVRLPEAHVIVLDALRKQRNLSDYSGDMIPDAAAAAAAAAAECLASAQELLAHVRAWLQVRRLDLL